VVEDEPHLRRLQQRILSSIDAEVLLAGSVNEARDILGRVEVDMIVSDVRMPGESGLDLFHWIQHEHAHLVARFLFVTGDIDDPELLDMAQAEPHRFVQKPFRVQDYLAQVAATLA
jgi:DNA-binding NtrC family response regulator